MKNRIISFVLAAGILSACGGVDPVSSNDVSIDPVSSSIEPVSSDIKQIRWNEQVDADLAVTLGQYAVNLPLLEASSYESQNETTESGVTYTRITCFTEDSEDKAALYKVGLKVGGWTVEADGNSFVGNVRVSFDTFLLVTFAANNPNGKKAVTIAAWLYHDKVSVFPNDKVMEFCGHELPALAADFYTFGTGSLYGITVLQLTCYGVDTETYSAYINTLKKEGWDMQVYYDSYSGYQESWGLYNQLTYYDVDTAMAANIETDRPVVTIDIYRA